MYNTLVGQVVLEFGSSANDWEVSVDVGGRMGWDWLGTRCERRQKKGGSVGWEPEPSRPQYSKNRRKREDEEAKSLLDEFEITFYVLLLGPPCSTPVRIPDIQGGNSNGARAFIYYSATPPVSKAPVEGTKEREGTSGM